MMGLTLRKRCLKLVKDCATGTFGAVEQAKFIDCPRQSFAICSQDEEFIWVSGGKNVDERKAYNNGAFCYNIKSNSW